METSLNQLQNKYYQPFDTSQHTTLLKNAPLNMIKSYMINSLVDISIKLKTDFQKKQFEKLVQYITILIELIYSDDSKKKIMDIKHYVDIEATVWDIVSEKVYPAQKYSIQPDEYLTIKKYKNVPIDQVHLSILISTFANRCHIYAQTFDGQYFFDVQQTIFKYYDYLYTLSYLLYVREESQIDLLNNIIKVMHMLDYVYDFKETISMKKLFVGIENCFSVLSKNIDSFEKSEKFLILMDTCYSFIRRFLLATFQYEGYLTYQETQNVLHDNYDNDPEPLSTNKNPAINTLENTFNCIWDRLVFWDSFFAKERDETMQKMRKYYPHLLRVDILNGNFYIGDHRIVSRTDPDVLNKLCLLIAKNNIYDLFDQYDE